MENGDLIAEVRAQSSRKDRRQSYLRHEHHCSATGFKRSVHGANVNLSLAAAGYSMKQEWRKASLGNSFFNCGDRGRLGVGECVALGIWQFRSRQWIASHIFGEFFDNAFLLERRHDGFANLRDLA